MTLVSARQSPGNSHSVLTRYGIAGRILESRGPRILKSSSR